MSDLPVVGSIWRVRMDADALHYMQRNHYVDEFALLTEVEIIMSNDSAVTFRPTENATDVLSLGIDEDFLFTENFFKCYEVVS